MHLGAKYLALGTKYTALATEHLALRTKHLVLGTVGPYEAQWALWAPKYHKMGRRGSPLLGPIRTLFRALL